jgi:ABC-type amino acid transport substrate-binding protein
MKHIVFALLVLFTALPAFASDKQANGVYDRVVKTRTLRCAYTIYPPFIAKDTATGEIRGLFHDLLEQMGKELNIKIVWAEEVGSDAIFSGLGTGRYDAVCAGYFSTPSRANGGNFTKPLVFVPTYLYVRKGEKRFRNLDDFNKPGIKIGTMDGESSQIFKNERFPLAGEMSLGGLSSAAERMELVATGKADTTFMEAAIGNEYMEHNPGKLEPFGTTPVEIGGSVIIVPHGEPDLTAYLNAAIDSLVYSGTLENIINKYQKMPGSFLLPAQPYQTEGK